MVSGRSSLRYDHNRMRIPVRQLQRVPPRAPIAATRGATVPSAPGTLFGIDVRTALSLAVLAGGAYFMFTYDPLKSMDFRAPKLPDEDDRKKQSKKPRAKVKTIYGDESIDRFSERVDEELNDDEDEEEEEEDE